MKFRKGVTKILYNRQTQSLKNGCKLKECTSLKRADKEKILQQQINQQKNLTDLCTLPFIFKKGDHSSKVYVLFNTFYCVFPNNNNRISTELKEYTTWLSKIKTVYPLPDNITNAIKRENKTVENLECLMAFHFYFIENKFKLGGFVKIHPEKISLIYYRTQDIPKDGIPIDRNIFNLIESSNDETTYVEVHDKWIGEIADAIATSQKGIQTNINEVPLDKTLYATVSVRLKPEFFIHQEHLGHNDINN